MDNKTICSVVFVFVALWSCDGRPETTPPSQCPSETRLVSLSLARTDEDDVVYPMSCVQMNDGTCKSQQFYVSGCTHDADEGVCKGFERNDQVGLKCQTTQSLVHAFVTTRAGEVNWKLIKVPSGCRCLFCDIESQPKTFAIQPMSSDVLDS